jgi:nitric oxide-associated protein 1
MLLFARTLSVNLIKRFHKPSIKELTAKIQENNVSSKYAKALEKFEGKIWFNSVLEIQKVRLKNLDSMMGHKRKKQMEQLQQQIKPLPLVLNQLCETVSSDMENPDEDSDDEELAKAQDLPYSRFLRVEKAEEAIVPKEEDRVPKDWLKDYELYDEADEEFESTYGTPDLTVPVSDVPCGGCGALLHCKDTSIPGYVPSELFNGLTHTELKTINCQRCHFLINYNTAINVTVTPDDYINIISTIKDKFALAIVLVDLLDFPCSIFSDLNKVLGPKRPIFIVGNKVDLIPKDQPDSLNHIKRCLMDEAVKMGFEEKYIKYVSLISATTGYGVEELITQLHNIWKYKGDVYLIGCTNVGKSSLFNALLRSDYCKVEASDLVQRATACPWPGTTLRMLKFPILKPSDFRLMLRTKRLQHEFRLKISENQLRKAQAMETKQIKHATLIGHIGRTFEKEKEELSDPSVSSHESGFSGNILTLNEKSEKYIMSKWCYDTPGVIQRDQVSENNYF